jgi:hypothetical protein
MLVTSITGPPNIAQMLLIGVATAKLLRSFFGAVVIPLLKFVVSFTSIGHS